MEDRRVYADQVRAGFLSFDVHTFDTVISYVSGEYLWGWLLNLFVRILGLSIEVTFSVISAFVIFTACLIIIRRVSAIFLLFLVNPIFVDLAFSQMRIALAIALASWAYLLSGRSPMVWAMRAALIAAASAVHTSAGIFMLLFVLCASVTDFWPSWSQRLRYFVLSVLGVFTAMFLGPWRGGILAGVGDRRVDAVYASWSMKYYLAWAVLLFALTADWRIGRKSRERSFALAALVTVFVGLGVGSYSNRVLAVSLPVLIVCIGGLSRPWRGLVVLAYVGYVLIYWFYWLGLLI